MSALRTAPLVMARMVASCITVAIPLLLARRLPLADYGSYKQAFLLCAPLLTVLPMGVVQSLYFFVPRTDSPRPVLVQTQGFNLAMGGIAAVALLALLPTMAQRFSNPELLHFRWSLAAYVLLVLGSNCLEPTLTTQGKTSLSAGVYVASEIIKSLALLLPVLLGYGVNGALWGMALFAGLRAVVASALVVKARGGWPTFSGLKKQLAYAVPFGAAMALNVPQQLAHQYAVGFILAPSAFAAYAAGCFQLPLVDLLYQPTSEVLMVRVGQLEAEGRLADAARLFRDATGKLSTFFIPLSVFMFVSAPAIVETLFGARFAAAVPIFRMSVLAVALASLPLDGLLRARNETRYLFLVYLTKALVTAPLLWGLVPRLGAVGGILAWLLVEVLGKGLLIARVQRALTAPGQRAPRLSEVLPLHHLVTTAAVAAGGGALVFAVSTAVERLGTFSGRTGAIGVAAAEGTLFVLATFAGLTALGIRPLQLLGVGLRRR